LIEIKNLNKITTQIKKYEPALREMYKNNPEKLKALYNTWRAYITLGRTAKVVGGGAEQLDTAGKAIDLIAGNVAPGKWYPYKVLRDTFNKFTKGQTEVFLRKAIFDPDYAQVLQAMSKGTVPEPRLNQLMTIISYEIGEQTQ